MFRPGHTAFALLATSMLTLTAMSARFTTGLDVAFGASESYNQDHELDGQLQRIREATGAFHDPAAARAHGYQATDHCVASPAGGMGYHYQRDSLMDDRLEVARPEILVYAPNGAASPKLAGVEYVVPYTAWQRPGPPRILGQALKKADQLQIWYLHVWVWEPNENGLFADWNPAVTCPQ